MVEHSHLRRGRCHCGNGVFDATPVEGFSTIRRCTCSDCRMRGAVVVSAELGSIGFVKGEAALTSYRYNTGTARHLVCSRRGMHTHHQRRPNPNLFGVNVACLDGVSPFDLAGVPVVDGVNHPNDTGQATERSGTLLYSATE